MSASEDWARKSIQIMSFDKYVAVPNPKNGDTFFDEVSMFLHSFFWIVSIFCIFLLPSLTSYAFF